MSLHYSRSIMRVAIAQICQQLGWDAIHSSALELILCIVERYVSDLGQQSHRFSELFGRTQPSLDDLGLAFNEHHVHLSELEDYVKHVDSILFPFDTVRFPALKTSCVGCLVHEPNDEVKKDDCMSSLDVEDGINSSHIAVQDSSLALRSSLASVNLERRLTVTSIPAESFPATRKLRMLPDEAAHSQYEMKSFIKTDAGILYPRGQGKLADCHRLRVDSPLPEKSLVIHDLEMNKQILSKLGSSKLVRERTKMRCSTTKNVNTDLDFQEISNDSTSENVHSALRRALQPESASIAIDVDGDFNDESVGEIDLKARETRLTAYEDAIDSVIRKVQTVENVCQLECVDEEKVEMPEDILCLPLDVRRVEREARISDTIDAVIAQAKSLTPCSLPIEGDHYNEEDEPIAVYTERPVVVESSASLLSQLASATETERMQSKHVIKPTELVGAISSETNFVKVPKMRKDKRRKSVLNAAVGNVIPKSSLPSESSSLVCGHSSVQPDKMLKNDKGNDSARCKNQGITNNDLDILKPEQSGKANTWTDDDDLRLPIAAAESLMKLAGVVPPQKRLRISFGSGKERTVEAPVIAESNEPVDKLAVIGSDLHVSTNNTKSKATLHEHSLKMNSDCHELEGNERSAVKEVEQKSFMKLETKKSKKLHKKSKEKQKSQTKLKREEKTHAIPKMTIKFGGGSSGGTPNSLSVGTSDLIRSGGESSTQAPLKLVIRPFITGSLTRSTKFSPHSMSKITKRHSIQQSDCHSNKLHHASSLLKNNISENKTRLSPAQFTSSSSSSSGSPYRDLSTDMPCSPAPPALSSPAPLISCESPNSESCSPLQSNSSMSRSPSPPTLYRSPGVEKWSQLLGNVTPQISETAPHSKISLSSVALPNVSVLPTKAILPNVRTVPAIPPPSCKSALSHKSVKAKQLVITETVSKVVDETGEITWICPACKMPDDGSPMIGCDICDDWYHWPCVGIVQEPPDEEQWFCKRCGDANTLSQIGKKGKNTRSKSVGAAEKTRAKKSSKKNK